MGTALGCPTSTFGWATPMGVESQWRMAAAIPALESLWAWRRAFISALDEPERPSGSSALSNPRIRNASGHAHACDRSTGPVELRSMSNMAGIRCSIREL